MSDKINKIDPRDIELKKLKDIIRNQINEIKDLKQELAERQTKSVVNADEKELDNKIKKHTSKIEEKYQKVVNSKDSIIHDLKRDLNLSKREIETHLRKHSEDLLSLHEQLVSERTSRDYLLANITQELVESIKLNSNEKSVKPISETSDNLKDAKVSLPIIEKVQLPVLSQFDQDNKLTILYASPQTPNFDESSGGKRAFLMLKLLAKDHNVYCYSKALSKEVHKMALETEGVKVINKLDAHHIIERVPNIDIIIAAWYSVFDEIEEICAHFSTAKLIVDTVDIHWVREERSLGKWDALTPEKQKENKEKEIEVYKKADVLWVVSEEDKKALKKEVVNADVRVVSNIHILKDRQYKSNKPNNILFFGGYNHYPNVNAIKLLAQNIFPKIKKEVSDAQLIIAGSNAPESVIDLAKIEGVVYKGFIEYEEIQELYDQCKLTVVPLTEGAGIKGKICEAIEYKTAVVTNDIGNEGILLETGIDGFVSNNYDEMALFSIDVLNDKYNLDDITECAQEKMKSLLGPKANLRTMKESFRPTVDICIVTYNRKDLLEKCVTSIFEHTHYPFYNIIIYSNGCTDGTKEYLEKLELDHENVEIILSDTNDVFVKPNNNMMLKNSSHDVVLLNNDVVVTSNWLHALVEEAYKSKKIGVVGSKILYPNGRLQEFGSELYITGSGINIGKGEDPNDIKYMYSKKASYVSGCSMFIKRSTLSVLGTFDEIFDPCYAEDSDYCYSAWEYGLDVNVTPKSIIYHFEGASSGTDDSKGFKRFQKINIQKFLNKHGASMENINKKVAQLNSEYPYIN